MIEWESLNTNQARAVRHQDGPALCVAGAGSGKTRALTGRIAYLIECGVDPEHILAITFTKKAAGEMKSRLDDLLGGLNTHDLTVATIHAVCYRILRDHWADTDQTYDVLAGYQQKRLFLDLLEEPSGRNPHGLNWDIDLKLAMSQISRWKTELVTPDGIARLVDRDEIDPRWYDLYHGYEVMKESRHQIDLDDMLVRSYEILTTVPAVMARWQHQWEYVLVDEAQDNSYLQWRLVQLLAAPQQNLFVVGDADQSIYGWRGARPDFFLDFLDHYPDADIIPLEINYRSLPYVVELGNTLINCNPRKARRATRAWRAGGPIASPVLWHPADEDDEAAEIVRYIQERQADGLQWRDVGILYRTHAQSQPIEDAFLSHRIPYRILGSQGFWARREVKDMLAYLRFTRDPSDLESFARAVMVPTRYLGKVYVRAVSAHARALGCDLLEAMRTVTVKPFQKRRGWEFIDAIDEAQAWDGPADRIQTIRDLTDYDAWFRRHDGGDDEEDVLANVTQLMHVARHFGTVDEFLAYVDRAALEAAMNDEDDGDHVTLLTIHRSKGLEWPTVILPGLCQGILPHQRALQEHEAAVEEERRLAYVAITRARDHLVFSAPQSRLQKGLEPSQFLDELGLIVTGDVHE